MCIWLGFYGKSTSLDWEFEGKYSYLTWGGKSLQGPLEIITKHKILTSVFLLYILRRKSAHSDRNIGDENVCVYF